MEFFRLYFDVLKDSSVPSHRVVRKTGALAAGLICALAYYRHVALGFGLGEPLLVTFGIAFVTFGVVGVFGGFIAGGFYDAFRKDVGAQRQELTFAVFFAEWLFAIVAPFLGLAFFASVSSHIG
jgi:hypothetical protein